MKFTSFVIVAILGTSTGAAPANEMQFSPDQALAVRSDGGGDGAAGIIGAIAEGIKAALQGTVLKEKVAPYANADSNLPPGLINFYISTVDGGHCSVQIAGSGHKEKCSAPVYLGQKIADCELVPAEKPDPWNVCYLNGVQYFSNDEVGDFSIEFTQAGGKNSEKDGLHHPILRFKNINNWEAIDVQAISDYDISHFDDPGNMCTWLKGHDSGRMLRWVCGVPVVGTKWDKIENKPPS